MAERTDCLLTRDLMFDAVPFDGLVLSVAAVVLGRNLRILQPTSLRREKPDPLELEHVSACATGKLATATYE